MMEFDVLDIPVGNASDTFRPRGDDEQELLLPELMAQTSPIADANMVDLSMALNKKLVIALSCLFLPMLAIVLGVQSSRKKNVYQSVIALLIIVIYHQLVEFAGDYGKRSELGPAVVLWSLYAAFFIATLVLFYKTTTGLGPLQDRIAARLDRIGMSLDPMAWLRGKPQTP
jgi:lipopolysaccharide export LptBFGC system permease protein LptF